VKITEFAITKKTISYFLVLILVGGGIWAYQGLGQLEFPSFTIKTAVVATPYPGASAEEVEQEVTDRIETAIQQMSQVDEVRSISQTGLSIIYVDIKNKYFTDAIPQIWDELRRKVSDAQIQLPPGAGPSMVNDDFGDVYGVFFAVTGDGYTYEELKDYVDFLKRELLLVENVASVDIWGDQQETIDLLISRSRLAELGISMQEIVNTLNLQNQVVDSGQVDIAHDRVRINPTGEFTSVEDLGDLLVRSDSQGNLIYLKDVVAIKRGYQDPPDWIMQYNGRPALGLGIATVDGGNVVDMGHAVRERIQELTPETPMGMEMGIIAYQSDLVSTSVKNFVVNLVQAVAIVIGVLCVTMGLASGMLMGGILLLTILGTFIFMKIMAIDFHIIFLCLPLATIGVTIGLLVFNEALGFMCILGFLGLSGMLIKNAVVLIDQIDLEIRSGKNPFVAILDSSVSRLRPVTMAALTTVLGMLPLLKDVFYIGMSVTIMGGLVFGTVLTLVVVPVLYAVFFRIRPDTVAANDNTETVLTFLKQAEADDRVRVMVMMPLPRKPRREEYLDFFSMVASNRLTETSVMRLFRAIDQVALQVVSSDLFFISANCGQVLPMFIGASLVFDYRILGDNAAIQNPSLELGLAPKGGASFFLSQTIGRGKVYDLLLAQEDITAEEALELGLEDASLPGHVTLTALGTESPEEMQHPDAGEWIDYAYDHRPDILGQDVAVKGAEVGVKQAKSGYYPTISLYGTIYGDSSDDSRLEEDDFGSAVGVQLTYNLFAGGLDRAKTREARQKEKEKENRKSLEQARLDAAKGIRSAIADLRAS